MHCFLNPSSVEKLSLLIVSSVRLYREGLADFLSRDLRVVTVDTAETLTEVDRALEKLRPNAVLLDWRSTTSREIAQRLASRSGSPPCLAFGVSEDSREVVACAEAGIVATIGPDGTIEDLVQATRSALAGEFRCSPKVVGALMRQLAKAAHAPLPEVILSPREFQVADLLEQGLTNKEIGAQLRIASSTARNHVHSILRKLNAHTRGEAAFKIRTLIATHSRSQLFHES